MSYTGYKFFVGSMELPYAPSELKVTLGSNNETVQLINGTEINILKDPKLRDVEFKVDLPRGRQYPFANKLVAPSKYIDYFNELLANKTPVKLLIIRQVTGANGTLIRDFEATDILVSLEDYNWSESAENAYDITVSLKFKEYIQYGTVKAVVVKTNENGSKSTATPTVDTSKKAKTLEQNTKYTVKSGDTLMKISRKFYGTSDKWEVIYKSNQTIIEETARKHGKKSSSNGHWIYPGCVLIIPGGKQLTEATKKVQTKQSKQTTSYVSSTHISSSGRTHGGSGGSFGGTHTSSSGEVHGGSGGSF